jgi:hypothetical protein
MNPNITINITVTSPEAVAALIHGLGQMQNGNPATINTMAPAPQQPAAPYPQAPYPQAPMAPLPPTAATPAPAPAPAPAQPAVPTSAATYTLDQLARAATPLIDSGKQQELVTLLNQFGVQALTQLPKEHYGAFATALRGMGAKI